MAAAYAVVCHRRHRYLRAHVRHTSSEGRDPDRSRLDEREMDRRLPRVARVVIVNPHAGLDHDERQAPLEWMIVDMRSRLV
jgi:hypothetical protein